MRNLKKLLAVLVVVAVMASMFAVPVFAEDSATLSAEAKACQALGMLEGRGDGLTDAYMKETQDRVQGALLQLRLYGVGKDAEAYTGTNNFSDAKTYAPWGQKVMAYLKDHPEYGWVGDAGKFMPKEKLTAQAYYKILLTSLGYEEGTDFTWANVIEKAKELAGLSKIADKTNLTTEDVAVATVEGLQAKVKGGTTTLIEKLVADEVFTEDQAVASGLYSTATTATAAPSAAKAIKVTFNKAVDTSKITFAVKKGSVVINTSTVAWDTDKKVATLPLVSKLTKGDYTITVNGSDMAAGKNVLTVAAEDETVKSIELASDVAPLISGSTNVTFSYVVKNQYGEDITAATTLTWTASSGTFAADPATGIKKLDGAFVKDGTFTVTAIHPSTTVFATKVMKVADSAKVAKINPIGLYEATNSTLYSNSTYANFYIKVEAFDQYGNKATLAMLNDATQTTVVSSNPINLIRGNGFVTIPGTTDIGLRLQDPTGTKMDGTATITFIPNMTAQSSQFVLPIAKPSTLDSLVLEKPADLMVKGEKVAIPFTAVDQNGVELTEAAKDALSGSIVTSTDVGSDITFDFVYNYQTKKTELIADLRDAGVDVGTVVIMAVTPTAKVSQITVDIKAAAIPQTVSAIKNFATKMTFNATSPVTTSDVVVIDQYGREMTLDTTWFTNYYLNFVSATTANVTVSAPNITAAAGTINLVGDDATTGTSVVTITIKGVGVDTIAGNADDTTVTNSELEFTAETVAKSAIASYTVTAPAKLYNVTTHKQAFTVNGVTASGEKVAIPAGDFVATSNDTDVVYSAGYLDADGAVFAAGVTERPVTVLVIINGANGPENITKTVTVTNVAPVITTLAAATVAPVTVVGDTAYVAVASLNAANLKGVISAKDQYGVAIGAGITNVIVTNITSTALAVGSNGQAAPTFTGAVAGDTFKVTFVTSNGLTIALNVVVTA